MQTSFFTIWNFKSTIKSANKTQITFVFHLNMVHIQEEGKMYKFWKPLLSTIVYNTKKTFNNNINFNIQQENE